MASFFRRKHAAGPGPTPEDQAPAIPGADDGAPAGDRSPLAERLRTMEWPAPTDDVRERCLREIMSRVGDADPHRDGQSRRPPEAGKNRAAG